MLNKHYLRAAFGFYLCAADLALIHTVPGVIPIRSHALRMLNTLKLLWDFCVTKLQLFNFRRENDQLQFTDFVYRFKLYNYSINRWRRKKPNRIPFQARI